MEKTKLLLIPLILVTFLVIIGTAKALIDTPVWTHPVDSAGVLGSTFKLTITILNNSGHTNVTFAYDTDATGDFTLIGTNTTGNLTTYTFTWDTTGQSDGLNYRLNSSAYLANISGTGILSSTIITGIKVDNTAPDVTYTVDNDRIFIGNSLTSTCTGLNSEVYGYAQTLTKPLTSTANTVSNTSTGTKTWTSDLLQEIGTYSLSCTTTSSNQSTAKTTSFEVYSSGGGGRTTQQQWYTLIQFDKINSRTKFLFLILAISIITIIIAVKSGKKKGRRR